MTSEEYNTHDRSRKEFVVDAHAFFTQSFTSKIMGIKVREIRNHFSLSDYYIWWFLEV